MNYRLCPFCNSQWVCWNWIQSSDDWCHECWDCDNCHSTQDEVKNGIPYETLKTTYPEENKIMGEIKACNEFLVYCCDQIVKDPKNHNHWMRNLKEHVVEKNKYVDKLNSINKEKPLIT